MCIKKVLPKKGSKNAVGPQQNDTAEGDAMGPTPLETLPKLPDSDFSVIVFNAFAERYRATDPADSTATMKTMQLGFIEKVRVSPSPLSLPIPTTTPSTKIKNKKQGLFFSPLAGGIKKALLTSFFFHFFYFWWQTPDILLPF